jgi:mono/diheme cytochrome c family protein
MSWLAPIAVALIAFAALAGCGTTGDDDTTETTGQTATTPAPQDVEQPLSPSEENGRDLFVQNCGSCHTFDAAGTQGQIGPNLDEAQVDRAQVLRAIETGGLGSGTMPANLVQGEDAEDVATFVAGSG